MPETTWEDLPAGLKVEQLYCSTGEDKGDDVNIAIGVRSGGSEAERRALFEALCGWLDEKRCTSILGATCRVSAFPAAYILNVLVKDYLVQERYDKQGKGLGRELLQRMNTAQTAS